MLGSAVVPERRTGRRSDTTCEDFPTLAFGGFFGGHALHAETRLGVEPVIAFREAQSATRDLPKTTPLARDDAEHLGHDGAGLGGCPPRDGARVLVLDLGAALFELRGPA
jgi:hypothetical protein